MDASSVLLNVKMVHMSDRVPQKDIQTEDDVRRYTNKGYPHVFMETRVKECCPELDTSNIYYLPSVSQQMIYFNEDTLAVSVVPQDIIMRLCGMDKLGEKKLITWNRFMEAITACEKRAANRDFMGAMMSLPDAMRVEYINMLLDKYPSGGQDIPNLFGLFSAEYVSTTYGFGRLRSDVLQKIVEARPEEKTKQIEKALADSPDMLTVYRGGSYGISALPEKASSWSIDMSVANFFAARMGSNPGYIAKGVVPKSKVILCRMDSFEKEIVVAPGDVAIQEKIELKGLKEFSSAVVNVMDLFHEYRDWLEELEFETDSYIHGKSHAMRVLMMSLLIAHYLGLPEQDKYILAEAAIYHDSKRDNDGEDDRHGYYSALYYQDDEPRPDPVTVFLIEYHCRPDEDGYEKIKTDPELSKNSERVRLLFDAFKDADALDRVRFGVQSIDLTQLRLPISLTLSVIANLNYRNLKMPGIDDEDAMC